MVKKETESKLFITRVGSIPMDVRGWTPLGVEVTDKAEGLPVVQMQQWVL